MAHLKCADGRRVVYLPTGSVFHRNGDGSRCTTDVSFGGYPVVGVNIRNELILESRGYRNV